MSKAVNILEVLEKAHQSKASVSKRNKQAIIDAYGRALTMQKVLADFIKVNRQLMIDLAFGENANLLHGLRSNVCNGMERWYGSGVC